MASSFDPAEINVIEDDYTSNLSYDESENAWTRRILDLCEYTRELQARVRLLEIDLDIADRVLAKVSRENEDLRQGA